MWKSFRFLFQFAWINLAGLLSVAVLLFLGACVTGVPQGADNLFSNYYTAFPLITLVVLFIFGTGLTTSSLHLALSFGARRRDYFLAFQGILLLYVGGCWLLVLVMSALPTLLGWTQQNGQQWVLLLKRSIPWLYPLICLALLCLGGVCGLLMARSKLLGGLALGLTFFVTVLCLPLLFLTTISLSGNGTWGILPTALILVLLTVTAGCEALFWRIIQKFVVR
jgi:hypothetical protein